MRLKGIDKLNSLTGFEACNSCPLKQAGLDNSGRSVREDVGKLIGAMKKVHPGVIVRNFDPPEVARQFVDEDDEAVGRFVVAAWHCVRIKQRHECENPAVINLTPHSEYL